MKKAYTKLAVDLCFRIDIMSGKSNLMNPYINNTKLRNVRVVIDLFGRKYKVIASPTLKIRLNGC